MNTSTIRGDKKVHRNQRPNHGEGEGTYALVRDAMRGVAAIPYNARGTLMTYQAYGLDNKKGTFGRKKFLFVGYGLRKRYFRQFCG